MAVYETFRLFEHHNDMKQTGAFHWKDRFRASLFHLAISLGIASLVALMMFTLWYPYPYRDTSGGRELFLIVVAVDVILGPLITFAIFDRTKARAVLVRDLAVVGCIQLVALSYGLWIVSAARPVHLVFEFDRFRAVHAVEVPAEMLDQVPAGVHAMPLTGPTVLAVRPFRDNREKLSVTLAALNGLPLGARPDLWQTYAQARERVLAAARPVSELRQRFPQQDAEIEAAVARSGRPVEKLVYLPMIDRKAYWTVLLDADSAGVRGFIPLDSF